MRIVPPHAAETNLSQPSLQWTRTEQPLSRKSLAAYMNGKGQTRAAQKTDRQTYESDLPPGNTGKAWTRRGELRGWPSTKVRLEPTAAPRREGLQT